MKIMKKLMIGCAALAVIYEKAEEHLKNMILHFLSGMDGYQVKFL